MRRIGRDGLQSLGGDLAGQLRAAAAQRARDRMVAAAVGRKAPRQLACRLVLGGIGVHGGDAADLAVVPHDVHHAEVREGRDEQPREALERGLVVQRRREQPAGLGEQRRPLARRLGARQELFTLALDLTPAARGVRERAAEGGDLRDPTARRRVWQLAGSEPRRRRRERDDRRRQATADDDRQRETRRQEHETAADQCHQRAPEAGVHRHRGDREIHRPPGVLEPIEHGVTPHAVEARHARGARVTARGQRHVGGRRRLADEALRLGHSPHDHAVAVHDRGGPLVRQLLGLEHAREIVRVQRGEQRAAQRAAAEHGHGHHDVGARRQVAGDQIRDDGQAAREDRGHGPRVGRGRKLRARRPQRVEHLSAGPVHDGHAEPATLPLERARGHVVKPLEVAAVDDRAGPPPTACG